MTKVEEALEILQNMKEQPGVSMVMQIHIDNLAALVSNMEVVETQEPEEVEYARVPLRNHNVL